MTGSGGPLANPRVHVFDATGGGYVTTAVPDAGGAYSIVLATGTYKLWVQPNTAGYADTWYGGPDFTGATTINLTADTLVDITVIGRFTLSGTVTGSGGPLANPRVHVFDATGGGYVTTAVPDAGGAYSIVLATGTYKLWVQPNTAGYADTWYGGPDFTGATTINLTADTLVDITVIGRFTLSGTVTGSGGPLANPRVHVFDATGGGYVTTAVPDAGGAYSIVLATGTYKLWVQPNTAGYADTWYGGPDFTGATTINLTADTLVDITIPEGS